MPHSLVIRCRLLPLLLNVICFSEFIKHFSIKIFNQDSSMFYNRFIKLERMRHINISDFYLDTGLSSHSFKNY